MKAHDRARTRIVFDLGGVVYRWRPEEIVMRVLPARAPTPDAAAAFVAAFFEGFDGDWSEFDRGTLEARALARRIARRIGIEVEEAEAVIAVVPDELQPMPDTLALALRLKSSGHALHFLSNMPRPYAEALTRRDELFGLFGGGVFSSDVQLVKPEPGLFEHAARVFRAQAQDLVLIDDAPRNIAAARAAGWLGVHFTDAATCARQLEAIGIVAA